MGRAAIPPGSERWTTRNRWCRRYATQPPANRFEPSGFHVKMVAVPPIPPTRQSGHPAHLPVNEQRDTTQQDSPRLPGTRRVPSH